MASTIISTAVEVETVALNAIVNSLFLCSGLATLDMVRSLISSLIQVPKNTNMFFTVTALMTTLLAVVGYMLIKAVARNVTIQKPSTAFAVTR